MRIETRRRRTPSRPLERLARTPLKDEVTRIVRQVLGAGIKSSSMCQKRTYIALSWPTGPRTKEGI